MKDSNYYQDQIVGLVSNIDDIKSLKMIYGLISKLIAIDDERVLNIANRLILGITKH